MLHMVEAETICSIREDVLEDLVPKLGRKTEQWRLVLVAIVSQNYSERCREAQTCTRSIREPLHYTWWSRAW
jgi:hypothetical protein